MPPAGINSEPPADNRKSEILEVPHNICSIASRKETSASSRLDFLEKAFCGRFCPFMEHLFVIQWGAQKRFGIRGRVKVPRRVICRTRPTTVLYRAAVFSKLTSPTTSSWNPL
jgi:hypothetical protein